MILLLVLSIKAIAYNITDVYLEGGSSILEGPSSGGTKVIFVADWPRIYTNDFEIYIGNSVCRIDDPPVEIQVLACVTPPQPEESITEYPIYVYRVSRFRRFGGQISETFKYITGTKITNIAPSEATPGDYISIEGNFKEQDVISKSVSGIAINPDGSLGRNTHGDLNIDLTLANTSPYLSWHLVHESINGEIYNFRTLAGIDSLSHSEISTLGGLNIKITGEGFPQDSSKVFVEINDIECKVFSIYYNEIECTTQRAEHLKDQEFYEGGPGLLREVWRNLGESLDQFIERIQPDETIVIPTPQVPGDGSGNVLYGIFKPFDRAFYAFYPQNGYVKLNDELLNYGESVFLEKESINIIEIVSEGAELSVGLGTSSQNYRDGNEKPLIQHLNLSDEDYKISFKEEVSSVISPNSSPEDIEDLLNKEIKDFKNSLVVSSVKPEVLEFKLPSYLFKMGNQQYISAATKDTEFKTLEVFAKPGEGKYWSVIPSDFLRTLEDTSQLRVWIDNTLALCRGNCDLAYVDLPRINSFYVEDDLLIIEGNSLPTNDLEISITVGEENCPLEFVDETTYKCLFQEGEVGEHQPVIENEAYEYEIASNDYIRFELEITNVYPDKGAENGGTYLILQGSGFPVGVERALEIASVSIGESPCEIRYSVPDELVCVTSAQTTDSLITLTVNGYTTTSENFSYDSNSFLEIFDVNPKYASIFDITELTIEGRNFGTVIEDLSVNIGPYECYVESVTDTEIKCKINGGEKGEYDVVVTKQGYPAVWTEEFPIVFEINRLSVNAGSIYGGTLMTVTGRGFSLLDEGIRVLIGRLGECRIIEVVSETTIICRTFPLPETLEADTDYEVEVYGKITELTDCTTDCSFRWSSIMSPRVDSISPAQGVAGDLIILRGVLFGEEIENVSLTFDRIEAEITSVSNQEIVAVVPSIMGSEPTLSLLISNLGSALLRTPFTNLENVLSVEPDEISVEGAIVQVSGSGFGSEEVILQGDLVCSIRESTNEYVVCQLGPGTCTEACAVKFLPSKTPEISEVSEMSGSVSITGDFLGELDFVTVGEYPCEIQESSLTNIACTPQAPPGSHELIVHITDFGFASGDFNITMVLDVLPISQENSSYAGGKLISLQGSGLHASNTISICGNEAEIVSDDGTEIRTPHLLTRFSQLTYSIDFEFANINEDLTKIGTNPALFNFAFDGNTTTFYSTQGEKWIGVDAGPGKIIQLSSLSVFAGGFRQRQYRELSGTMVQASNDLVNWETLYTFDQVNDSENVFRPVSKPIFRAFRIFKMLGGQNWSINEIEVYGALLIDSSENEYTCDIVIAGENGNTVTLEDAVVYSDSSTPVLNAISPKMASAFGGDQILFQGENLGASATIVLNNVNCPVVAATEQQLRCVTLPLFIYIEESLEILIEGKGYAATAGQTFLYAERWSDPRTWGGVSAPKEGESVHVYPGSTVILDTPTPPFEMILVQGWLIVEDIPGLKIETQVMSTRYGFFQVGTEEEPFTNEFELVLTGGKQDILYQTFGGKLLLVLSGAIDVHGVPRNPTWTFLETSAYKNEDFIIVSQDVDWKVGEEIVIAPTGFDYTEGEKRTIRLIDGRTLYLEEPLEHDHYSAIEKYGDKEIDMRAEVGLLTRNVKIMGDESSSLEGYGGAIQMAPAVPSINGRLSYIQFKRMGQQDRILRYPVHYHLMGAVDNSFVRGNSFEECYNRAVVVHGTVYTTIEDNVTYNITGHTYFLEDGNEFKNIFRRNLAIYTKPAYNMLLSDQTPAAFWFSNPDNFIDHNRAAGSYSYGFWFDQPVRPPLFVFGDAPLILCTQYLELGSFTNNTAHSNGNSGFIIEPRSIPLTSPCSPAVNRSRSDWWASNAAVTGYIQNFTAFKNRRYGVNAHDIGDIRFENLHLADNLRSGIQVGWTNFSQPFNSTRIDEALLVGRSRTNNEQMKGYTGVVTPQTDGMLVRNVHFYNIEDDMNPLGDSLFSDILKFADYGARLHKLSGITFNNSNRKIKWNNPFRGIYEDQDGSLTGTPGAFVTPYWPHLETEECSFDESLDSLVCIGEKVRRVHLYSPQPLEGLIHKVLTVGYNGKYSHFPMITTDEKKDIKYSWAVPFVTGHEYEVFWEDDWDALSFEIETFEGEEFVILNFDVTSQRVSYSGRRGVANDNSTVLSEVSSLSSTDSAGTYSWGADFFKIILSGVPGNPNQFNDIQMIATSCCSILSSPMSSTGTFKWSEASSWAENRLPEEGDSVAIKQGVTMILDIDTPTLKYLEINGRLELDSERSVTLNSELIFIRLGSLVSGGDSQLRQHIKHSIVLHGAADLHLPGVDVGDKVLINQGELILSGYAKTTSVPLVQNALPGEKFIYVNEVANWEIGDSIGLSASGFDTTEVEEATIARIESGLNYDRNWNSKEKYRNYGKNNSINREIKTETSDQSKENIYKIHLKEPLKYYHSGTFQEVDSKTVDMRSEVVNLERNIEIVGSVLVMETETPSKTILHDVKLIDSEQTAIRIQDISQGSAEVKGSLIKNAYNRGVHIKNSTDIIFEYNGLFNIKWRGIEIESAQNSSISYNVILNVVNRGLTDSFTDEDAAIVGCTAPESCSNTSVWSNRAGGYSFAGFIGPAGDCSGHETFWQNYAHSGYVGWILTNDAGDCVDSSSFTSTFNEQGVGSVLTVQSIHLKNFRLAENKIGIALRSGVAETLTTVFNIEVSAFILQSLEDSLIIGKTQHSSGDNEECRVGLYMGFADETESTEIEVPLYASRGYSHVMGNFTLYEVSFANFVQDCQYAIQSNPLLPDSTIPMIITKTEFIDVPQSSLIYISEPWAYCSEILCSGPRNLLIQDTDGSMLGERGAIIPNNPGVASKDICTFMEENNAYFCLYKETGYYEVLVFDQPDSSASQITPSILRSFDISFESHLDEGFHNELTTLYDFDEDRKTKARLSGIVFTGLHYNWTFEATVFPQARCYLVGTLHEDEPISIMFDFYYPMESGVHRNGTVVPAVGYIYGEERNPNLMDPHGSNKWYLVPHVLEVIVRNEEVLGVASGSNLQVALNIEYFLGTISQNVPNLPYFDATRAFSGIPWHTYKSVAPFVQRILPGIGGDGGIGGNQAEIPDIFDF